MARNPVRIALLGVGLLLAAAAPMLSHHSISAEFDQDQPIEFTGRVLQVDWLNPHIYTHVEVERADGTKVVYKVEGGPPNTLFRRGFRSDTLKPGQIVSVEGIRARNPSSPNIGSAVIRLEDGSRVF